MYRITTIVGAAASLSLGCIALDTSDQGQWEFEAEGIPQLLQRDSHHVLVGSEFRVNPVRYLSDQELVELDEMPACVAFASSGALSNEGRSYTVDAAGVGAVEFGAPDASCPEFASLDADSWTITAVAPEDARATWTRSITGLRDWLDPGPAETWPMDVRRSFDAGARVVAGGQFSLESVLVRDQAGGAVEVRRSRQFSSLEVSVEHADLIADFGDGDTTDGLTGALAAHA